MKRYRRFGFYPNRTALLFKAVCVSMAALTLVLIADARIRPIVRSMGQTQAVILATDAIDNAVTEVLSSENTCYDDLVRISTDADGRITAIQTRTVEINKLKSVLSVQISEEIENCRRKRISVPLGTVLGSDFFSGRGPQVRVYITISGSAQVQITHSFESTGINQTRHQILLDVSAKIYIIMAGVNVSTDVQTNFVIAETVIVGNVPDTYLEGAQNSAPFSAQSADNSEGAEM